MRTVRDIMEPDVFWLPADMPLKRAAEELSARQIGGAPACAPDGEIIGMVSKTDLTEHYGENDGRVVRDVMTPELFAVGPDDPIDRAIHSMAFEGVHRLLVLDHDERLLGIVTTMDILRDLAGFPRRRPRVLAVGPPDSTRTRQAEQQELIEDLVDATLADSFPASDPPFWTLGLKSRVPVRPHI